jgi:hypothetical protein
LPGAGVFGGGACPITNTGKTMAMKWRTCMSVPPARESYRQWNTVATDTASAELRD